MFTYNLFQKLRSYEIQACLFAQGIAPLPFETKKIHSSFHHFQEFYSTA